MTDEEIIEKGKRQLLGFVDTKINNLFLGDCVRAFMKNVIDQKFWEYPASSSGKYHPEYSLGIGGLVRHTVAAVTIAIDLLEISKLTSEMERDCVIAAIIMHDSCKQGLTSSGHTVFDHPVIAANAWREHASNYKYLDADYVETIAGCIASHMGKWNTSNYSKVELPKPTTRIQKFVHICDYLASRKSLSVNLDFYTI